MTLVHQVLPLGSTCAVLPSGVSLARMAILLCWSGLSHRSVLVEVRCTSTVRPIAALFSVVTETFHNLAASIKVGLATVSDLVLNSERWVPSSETLLFHPHSTEP